MAGVVKIKQGSTLEESVREALRDWPEANRGVVIVFGGSDEEEMAVYYKTNRQQLALASIQLSRLAAQD